MPKTEDSDRLVSTTEVMQLLGYSRGRLRQMIKTGALPAPLRPSTRRNCWKLSTIKAWIETLEAASTRNS